MKLEEKLSVGKSSLKWKETGIGKTDLYSFKFIKNNDSNFLVWVKHSYFKKTKGINPHRGDALCKIIMFILIFNPILKIYR